MAKAGSMLGSVGKWAISSRYGVLRFKDGTVQAAVDLYAKHFNQTAEESAKMLEAGEYIVTEWSDGGDPGKAVAEVHGKGGGGNKQAKTN